VYVRIQRGFFKATIAFCFLGFCFVCWWSSGQAHNTNAQNKHKNKNRGRERGKEQVKGLGQEKRANGASPKHLKPTSETKTKIRFEINMTGAMGWGGLF
jgi:hypothetical protein